MTEDLTELKAVDRADVYKQNARVATLTRTRDGVEFAYLPTWVAEAGSPVSVSLPVTDSPLVRPGGALPAFFEGLLPEGRRLGALRREVKTSADDELSLLLAVGADAVGDVQVVPEGILPGDVAPRIHAEREFSHLRFTDLLAELGIKADRVALPGVQDKVSAAMLSVPLARRGERYILKLTPPEFPHLVENEYCFLRAGRAAGIHMAKAELVRDADGVNGLLVQRFDRLPGSSGESRALAAEDACQVLAVPPADKYRLSSEAALLALARVCQSPLAAARALLTQLVFVYLTGNGDAHAKNFSILQDAGGEWKVSPAYDVPSSQPYGDSTLALSINSRTSDPGTKDFLELGRALQLPDRAPLRVLSDQATRVDAWIPLLDELPFDAAAIRKLTRVVRHRRDRIAA